jgi:hypothetical protein
MDRLLPGPKSVLRGSSAGNYPPVRPRADVALSLRDRLALRHQGALLATAYILLAIGKRAGTASVDVAVDNARRISDAIREVVNEVSPL